MRLQEDKIRKIRDAPGTQTKKGVRSFLGLTGFYRNFVPNYAAIASPLTVSIKKKKLIKFFGIPRKKGHFKPQENVLIKESIFRFPDLSIFFPL